MPGARRPPGVFARGAVAGRAVSRVLFLPPPCCDRQQGRWSSVWDGRHRPPLAAYPRLAPHPRGIGIGVGHTSPPIWPCSDWGLPCRRCYQRRGGLLPHRFTLTLRHPLARGGRAVCSLLPCPSPFGAQALPGSLPCGARTFLETALRPPRDHHAQPAPSNITCETACGYWSSLPQPGQPLLGLLDERLQGGVGGLPLGEDLAVLLARLRPPAELLVGGGAE